MFWEKGKGAEPHWRQGALRLGFWGLEGEGREGEVYAVWVRLFKKGESHDTCK